MLKTYNQPNLEQHSKCSIKIRYNFKCVKYTFFVVPGNGSAFLWMSDIELLSIIRVMCETIDNKGTDRKFDVLTMHAADSQNCKIGTPKQGQMQIAQVKTEPAYPVILILAQKSYAKLFSFPATTMKLTREQVRQSQTQCTTNLMTFSLVKDALKAYYLCK